MSVGELSRAEILQHLSCAPDDTLANSHRRTRAKIEDVLEKHAAGADSIVRPTNVPVKNGRPGVGRAREAGFVPMATVLSVGRLADEKGHYVNLAARIGHLGRPTSALSDFGEPEAPDNIKYRQVRVELVGEGVGQTMLYGLLIDVEQWVEIADLRRVRMTNNHSPDREIFMNSCLIPTTARRHGGKIRPYWTPVQSIVDQQVFAATAVPSEV